MVYPYCEQLCTSMVHAIYVIPAALFLLVQLVKPNNSSLPCPSHDLASTLLQTKDEAAHFHPLCVPFLDIGLVLIASSATSDG